MGRRGAWLAILCGAACSAGGFVGDEDGAPGAGGEDAAPRADANPAAIEPDASPGVEPARDPSSPGPWLAGVRTVVVEDAARGRSFSVDVWYPVDPAASGGESNEYRLESLFGTLASIDSPARRDAPPAPGGPWPLVVFSHGYGGIRFQSYFLTEHLATHGFVVAAPDHPGNTLTDFAQLGDDAATAQSAIDRPLDVAATADRLIAGTAGVPLAIDGARLAVSGHSFGGWTALEVARRDPRFRVVVPLAPGFRAGSTPDFVASLGRPLLLFGGSEDGTCPFETDQLAPYDLAQPPKGLVKVIGAGHLDFSNLCEVPLAAQFVDDGCDPGSIEPADVHARVNTLATAFVYRYLTDAPTYDAFLDPSFANGLGALEYWRAP